MISHFDEWPIVFSDSKMTAALLDSLTKHCDITEIGDGTWRYKGQTDDHTPNSRLRLSP